MGMSSWILSSEEKFWDIISDAVKEAEHISEAYNAAMKNKNLVAHLDDNEVIDMVDEFWNDFWSKYNG